MTWHYLALQTGLGDSLASQPALALALLFGAGVLTSLTPCIYPMIPITAGIISGTAGEAAPRSRAGWPWLPGSVKVQGARGWSGG